MRKNSTPQKKIGQSKTTMKRTEELKSSSLASLKNNLIAQPSTPKDKRKGPTPRLPVKTISKGTRGRTRSNDSRQGNRKSRSGRKTTEKTAAKAGRAQTSSRKGRVRDSPSNKPAGKKLLSILERLEKESKEKKESKKLALAEKKRGNGNPPKYEIRAMDSNKKKRIYSVEIVPLKHADTREKNKNALPRMDNDLIKYVSEVNNSIGRASTFEDRAHDLYQKFMKSTEQPIPSQMYPNGINANDGVTTTVPSNFYVHKTRSAHSMLNESGPTVQNSFIQQPIMSNADLNLNSQDTVDLPNLNLSEISPASHDVTTENSQDVKMPNAGFNSNAPSTSSVISNLNPSEVNPTHDVTTKNSQEIQDSSFISQNAARKINVSPKQFNKKTQDRLAITLPEVMAGFAYDLYTKLRVSINK